MSWTKRDPKRSYQCDGTQLKKIRSSRGWSQRLLAQKAGYSERLISKAEANGQVTVDALEILAQTLTTDAEPVFPEDLIGSPEGLARSFSYAVYHLQNKMFDRVKHFIHEDVVFYIHGDRTEVPFAGTYRGLDGFETAIETFFRTMEIPEEEKNSRTYDYFTNQDEVVVLGETNIHPVGHPRKEPKPVSQLMRFKDGKLIHFEDRYDISRTGLGDLKD